MEDGLTTFQLFFWLCRVVLWHVFFLLSILLVLVILILTFSACLNFTVTVTVTPSLLLPQVSPLPLGNNTQKSLPQLPHSSHLSIISTTWFVASTCRLCITMYCPMGNLAVRIPRSRARL